MKKLLQTIFLILFAQAVFAQQPCQASFTYYYDGTSLLYLNDASFNPADSMNPPIITAYNWTVQFGGASYTYSTSNPIIQVGNYNAPILVCYTIATSIGCTSTICDTVYLNNSPPAYCNADFMYQTNGFLNNYLFTDLSSGGSPVIAVTSWNWVISDSLQNILFTSTLQNPSFTFPANGVYTVCLTIATDSGCTDTQCYNLSIPDSLNQNNCQLYVSSYISHVTIIGGNDGFIDLTVSGGTAPYFFNWSTGATTEDIDSLASGVYTVNITQSDTSCPSMSYTFQILEPYNTNPLDTLFTFPLDTCLNFLIDTFYISNITVSGNIATVTWVFQGGGATAIFTVTYTFGNNGTYVLALTINCLKSSSTTYMTYVNIASYLEVENAEKADVRIYPNPFTGAFWLNLPQETAGDVQIYNSTGQIIYNARTTGAINAVDASKWPAGIYLIRVITGNDIITHEVIKE